MKRKKEGASLIAVVVVFMFVTTVSMATLSMVASNYKARVAESKRIENLYASDSGLDVAYNIMAKTFDAATKYGYYKVQDLKSLEGNSPNKPNYKDLEDDIKALEGEIEDLKKVIPSETRTRTDINNEIKAKNDLITKSRSLEQLLLNEEFKRTFKNFIKESTDPAQLGVGEAAPSKLEDSIKNYKFVDVSIDNNGIKFDDKIVEFGIDNNNTVRPTLDLTKIDEPIPVSGASETKEYELQGLNKKINITTTPQEKYKDIIVTSNFFSEKFNGTNVLNGTNERTVAETFDMIVPNFNEAYYQEAASEMNEYLATKDRALTVHGNMYVTGANNFTVSNGDLFVEGVTPTVGVTTRSYKKYNGGIMIADSNEVKFSGDVITRNSFNIRNDAKVTIDKNLYGRNVYLGGQYYRNDLSDGFIQGLDEAATNSQLYVNSDVSDGVARGQIVIDNDLALKAQGSESKIIVNDFYGINDKTITTTEAYGHAVDKVKSSSSIIVNTTDNSSKIDIKQSAYIMGTAHINTNETDTDSTNQYQTGESGAVKGNFIAYSVPLNEAEKFAYYDPLQLLDTDDAANPVEEKADHFTKYWKDKIDKNQAGALNTGGIILPHTSDGTIIKDNIWSAGAIVYQIGSDKFVVESHYMSDLEDENVDPKDKNVGAVYNKQTEFAKMVYRFNQEATKKYDYDYEKLTPFSHLVDTSKIALDLGTQNNKGEYAIFNGDNTKEIKIEKEESANGIERIDTTDNTIYVTNKETDNSKPARYELNAVIVTKGKLSIGENITINGCVIVDGDLNINNPNITINYDPGVIGRVQAKNSGIFQAVFGGWIIPPDNNDSIDNDSGTLASAYDLSHFLEKKLWKISK